MSTQRKTERLRLLVEVDVLPRPGQEMDDAVEEMRKTLVEYLTEDDKPFFEDYGARLSDVEQAEEERARPLSWGGYEGPFATGVTVSENGVVKGSSQW